MTFIDQAHSARQAAITLATLTRGAKDASLQSMADSLAAHMSNILAANALDVETGQDAGMDVSLIDRLSLTVSRVDAMVEGLLDLVALPDPVGETVAGWDLANGLHIDQVRVPMGVIGIIYEARPNVTADAAGICLKAGNAVLLRGSSTAIHSNRAVVAALKEGLVNAGIDPNAVNLVEGGHEVTGDMMKARGLVDLLIPRGGASLIAAVVTGSQVPVIETGTGNCHIFVDSSADLEKATAIVLNAKVQRPSVCNALETLLVHEDIAAKYVPEIVDALVAAGVKVHGDEAAMALDPRIDKADQWDAEFLSLDLRVGIVAGVEEAISFIREHTSGHSETILTNDLAHQRLFVAEVDAACVLVNASSRFVDGGQFGFGAEIGISTQKLHARGPMGLKEMTATKYVITGEGQTRV
ncbi:MAG: glutamate-5-semialdehyde dehydrogenase [Propionibacteriaceae bacterium]|jgi:glutamate-5-semialdehyde dehydrogenase|nr:glutamate-5-semialdehyde dehydrogenase [Propionibacteriaceae bacterium]